MPLDPNGLATAIKDAMGKKEISPRLLGEATAIVTELTTIGIVMHPPNTIMGIAPSGGPLQNGEAQPMGKILGIEGAGLAALMMSNMGFPMITPQLLATAIGICTHILAMGMVSFKPGKILAVCSNSAVSAGAVTGLACTGGTISGLNGKAMALLIAPALGGAPTDELNKKCTAICDYIMKNAIVQYLPGAVTGLAPAGGGPISAGTAVGGKIT